MADEEDELETALADNAKLRAENSRLRHGKPKKVDPNVHLKEVAERLELEQKIHKLKPHHSGWETGWHWVAKQPPFGKIVFGALYGVVWTAALPFRLLGKVLFGGSGGHGDSGHKKDEKSSEHHAGPGPFKKIGFKGFTVLLVILAVATAYAFDATGRQNMALHDLSGYMGLLAGLCILAVLAPVGWRVLSLSFTKGSKSGNKPGGAHH